MNISFIYQGTTHVFRRPDLGNTDDLNFQRINRRSRGGDINIFRDTEWPKTETQSLKFTFTKESDLRRLLNFIGFTLGQIIQYVDHEGVTWEGVIQNPTAEGTQTGRSIYEISIIFEGDQV
jgi:hypothetical protein